MICFPTRGPDHRQSQLLQDDNLVFSTQINQMYNNHNLTFCCFICKKCNNAETSGVIQWDQNSHFYGQCCSTSLSMCSMNRNHSPCTICCQSDFLQWPIASYLSLFFKFSFFPRSVKVKCHKTSPKKLKTLYNTVTFWQREQQILFFDQLKAEFFRFCF